MLRLQSTKAIGLLTALLAVGCSSRSGYYEWTMESGTATFVQNGSGLLVSGAFTLRIDLDDATFDIGETSDVYLYHLGFSQDYSVSERSSYLYQGFDAELTGADVPSPYEVTVGTTHRARFNWQVALPPMAADELCAYGLRAEVYFALGDELDHSWLEVKGGGGYWQEALQWAPDPCPSY